MEPVGNNNAGYYNFSPPCYLQTPDGRTTAVPYPVSTSTPGYTSRPSIFSSVSSSSRTSEDVVPEAKTPPEPDLNLNYYPSSFETDPNILSGMDTAVPPIMEDGSIQFPEASELSSTLTSPTHYSPTGPQLMERGGANVSQMSDLSSPLNPPTRYPCSGFSDGQEPSKVDPAFLAKVVEYNIRRYNFAELCEMRDTLPRFEFMIQRKLDAENSSVPSPRSEFAQGKARYLCKLCENGKRRIYRSLGSFKRHVTDEHDHRCSYRCSFRDCPWTTYRKDKIHEHYRNRHQRPGRLSSQDIRRLERRERIPQECRLCYKPVETWDEYFHCVADHCRLAEEYQTDGPWTQNRRDGNGRGGNGGNGGNAGNGGNGFGYNGQSSLDFGASRPSNSSHIQYGNGSTGQTHYHQRQGSNFSFFDGCYDDDYFDSQCIASQAGQPPSHSMDPVLDAEAEGEAVEMPSPNSEHVMTNVTKTGQSQKAPQEDTAMMLSARDYPTLPSQLQSLDPPSFSDRALSADEILNKRQLGPVRDSPERRLPRENDHASRKKCVTCGHVFDGCSQCQSTKQVTGWCHLCAAKCAQRQAPPLSHYLQNYDKYLDFACNGVSNRSAPTPRKQIDQPLPYSLSLSYTLWEKANCAREKGVGIWGGSKSSGFDHSLQLRMHAAHDLKALRSKRYPTATPNEQILSSYPVCVSARPAKARCQKLGMSRGAMTLASQETIQSTFISCEVLMSKPLKLGLRPSTGELACNKLERRIRRPPMNSAIFSPIDSSTQFEYTKKSNHLRFSRSVLAVDLVMATQHATHPVEGLEHTYWPAAPRHGTLDTIQEWLYEVECSVHVYSQPRDVQKAAPIKLKISMSAWKTPGKNVCRRAKLSVLRTKLRIIVKLFELKATAMSTSRVRRSTFEDEDDTSCDLEAQDLKWLQVCTASQIIVAYNMLPRLLDEFLKHAKLMQDLAVGALADESYLESRDYPHWWIMFWMHLIMVLIDVRVE